MRISDWSSDVCSSDLVAPGALISIGGPRCKQFLHYTRREARRKASYINAVGIVQRSNVIAEPGEDIEVVEHDRGGARQTGPFCDHRWHRQRVRIAFAFGCERSDSDTPLSGIDSNDDAWQVLPPLAAMLGLMVEGNTNKGYF